MGKILRFCLLLFTFTLFSRGDGIILTKGSIGNWGFVEEGTQVALINYRHGVEKMIIKVTTVKPARDVFWLLPIPAPPDDVKVEIITSFPHLYGTDVFFLAKDDLRTVNYFLIGSQIYPLPFIATPKRKPFYEPPLSPGAMGPPAKGPSVVVHEHIEKGGITAEKITAKDGKALYQYLRNQGLNIAENSIPILNHYIGQDYTFIVSWISSISSEESSTTGGIYLTFPSSRIYYPLKPTSVYGAKGVEVSLYLIGYYQPFLEEGRRLNTYVSWEVGRFLGSERRMADFLPTEHWWKTRFTYISLSAPAKEFTSDLWIEPRPFGKAHYADFITTYSFPIGLFIYLISSLSAGYIAGFVALKRFRNAPMNYIYLALANCASLAGLIFVTLFLPRARIKDEKIQTLLRELRDKGYVWKRRLCIILCLMAVFAFLLAFAFIEFTVTEEGELHLIESAGIYLWAFSFLLLVFALRLGRIKEEDREKFALLREYGINRWLFASLQVNKPLLILLFSFVFLVLGEAMIALLRIPLR